MGVLQCSGIILAGGTSRRLGIDKRHLCIGGQTILERTVELLTSLCTDTIVVTGQPDSSLNLRARCVSDIYPGKGVLGGLYTGLINAGMPYSLVVAADMPFLNAAVLAHLASLTPGYDVVIPLIDGLLEPLHAVYSQACIAPIERYLLAEQTQKVISFFHEVRVRTVAEAELRKYDPALLSFFNINTPDDIERARQLLQRYGLDIEGIGQKGY